MVKVMDSSLESEHTKMMHDLAAKAAADVMVVLKRTASLVPVGFESSFVALTLQYLVGTYGAYLKMPDEDFNMWLSLMADCKRVVEAGRCQ